VALWCPWFFPRGVSLHITTPLAAALMIIGPGLLSVWILRRLGTAPRLVLLGAATFLVSQALRLPALKGLSELFDSGVLPAPDPAYHVAANIAVLALTSGIFEEGARYLAYRHVLPGARSWGDAVTFGVGHGGIESVLVGVLMALGYVGMTTLAADDPRALSYWATPWYSPLLGALERAFAIALHLALAASVLVAVVRKRPAWLLGAIVAHAATNAAGSVALARWGPIGAEVVLGLVAAAALVLLLRIRPLLPGP